MPDVLKRNFFKNEEERELDLLKARLALVETQLAAVIARRVAETSRRVAETAKIAAVVKALDEANKEIRRLGGVEVQIALPQQQQEQAPQESPQE